MQITTLTADMAAQAAADYLAAIDDLPPAHQGRGIVTCAGGARYNTCAWVLINMLRELGCRLPIQVWYLGKAEEDRNWIRLVEPLNAECVDAEKLRLRHPHPRLGGWELKPYAILHSPFREVLFLDADNVPVVDPTFLFQTPQYQATGTIFWPDGLRTPRHSPRWRVFGVPCRSEPEQESGQIVIDKGRSWPALRLCNWYNEHSDFFYRVVYGDKDTFRFAWHRVGQPFAMPQRGLHKIPGTLCQHDFQGRRIFQHRCLAKWSLARNRRVPGFLHEERCLQLVEELRRKRPPLGTEWEVNFGKGTSGVRSPIDVSEVCRRALRPFGGAPP